VFRAYGLTNEEIAPVLRAFTRRPQAWVDFMMRYELGLEKPEPKRAIKSAATIAGAYVVGGFVPLLPYMAVPRPGTALLYSIVFTILALLIFGFVKGRFTGTGPLRGALQTATIGGLAACAAFIIAKAVA